MSDILIQAETRLNEMIADIGETTGKQHPTLNDGVQELKKGYGQGGDPYEIINSLFDGTITDFYTEVDIVSKYDTRNLGLIFNECDKLERFAMPNNTISLGDYFFRFCPSLSYIDVGKMERFSFNFFYGHHLKNNSIVIRTQTVATLSGVFLGTSFNENTVFYVPKSLVEEYKTATNWSAYADYFKAIEDYPEITGGII